MDDNIVCTEASLFEISWPEYYFNKLISTQQSKCLSRQNGHSGLRGDWLGGIAPAWNSGNSKGSGFKPTGVHMKLLANPLPLSLTLGVL
jgi:hypothetical protein